MRHLSRILFLLGATLSSVGLSHAQKLTITDNLAESVVGSVAKHPPIQHWAQFSTTLSAKVTNPPKSHDEIEIAEDPTYEWSGGTSIVRLTSTVGQTSGLKSVFPPITDLPAGENNISVHCTASYARKDLATGEVDAIKVSGDLTVQFFSRVPLRVKEIRNYPEELGGFVSPYIGPVYFGQKTYYDLQVQDNQPTYEPYGYGAVEEDFVPPITGVGGQLPNGPGGGSTWPVNMTGGSSDRHSSVVGGNFVDHNGYVDYIDRRLAPDNWTANTLIFDFGQSWFCLEAKPPYPSPYDQSTPLLPHHHLTEYYLLPTIRTGG